MRTPVPGDIDKAHKLFLTVGADMAQAAPQDPAKVTVLMRIGPRVTRSAFSSSWIT
jgi:hypothetical protein